MKKASPNLHALETGAQRHEAREPARDLEESLLAAVVTTILVANADIAHAPAVEAPLRQSWPPEVGP